MNPISVFKPRIVGGRASGLTEGATRSAKVGVTPKAELDHRDLLASAVATGGAMILGGSRAVDRQSHGEPAYSPISILSFLEAENFRLRQAVVALSLDTMALREALEKNEGRP